MASDASVFTLQLYQMPGFTYINMSNNPKALPPAIKHKTREKMHEKQRMLLTWRLNYPPSLTAGELKLHVRKRKARRKKEEDEEAKEGHIEETLITLSL